MAQHTYSTQWESPSETGGQWRTVVSKDTAHIAEQALKKLVQQRRHCRMVWHQEGREDYVVDERGPFNGGMKVSDR